jgi:hypothetical protein
VPNITLVRHASGDALERVDALIIGLRALDGVKEKKPGTFYRGPRALLHFHEDGEDLFADVRLGDEWERVRVTSAEEQVSLLERLREG